MMRVRRYGSGGPLVIVIHGGPGAGGSMAPVARGLADLFRVLEPFQRAGGDEPLTVARHVEDLRELVSSEAGSNRPALVGHSWGAMLALAYAASHPASAGPLVLIGCGTFDERARDRLRGTVDGRITPILRRCLENLSEEFRDPDERLRAMGKLIMPLYSYDAADTDDETEVCDARANEETWNDMLRSQKDGIYPRAFAAIKTPVLMLHGAADPHPGEMIRSCLAPFLPQLEYRELNRCGHYPWLERRARDEFFRAVRGWLKLRTLEC